MNKEEFTRENLKDFFDSQKKFSLNDLKKHSLKKSKVKIISEEEAEYQKKYEGYKVNSIDELWN